MDRSGADYVKVEADDNNDDDDIILADDEIDAEDELASLQDADPLHSQAKSTDQLQRQLNNRQIQLFAIGGSIGTALFVSIGDALQKGGPGSLLLAFALQSLIVACVNNCMAEMGVLFPVSGGFIRMAGKWVDDALGFMAGYNFFLLQALIIPFEITALNLILGFWSDNIPIAAVCAVTIFCYAVLNTLAVRTYGEAEFWLSGGKFILICILFLFTLITTLGGNPKHDAYGFRYWDKPGAFAEYLSVGSLGRFEGFLACLWTAAFTVCGPEYIAMVAAEAKHPRVYVKAAYESVYVRFGIFFVGGALCTGLVIPYNDPQLLAALTGADGGEESAAASPYVIAMTNLGISVLPHVVNALLVTSVFSAGNTCTYCATRSLYGLALDGRAPRFLRYCTSSGVPIACFGVVICFPFLSFLAVTRTSAQVLSELVSLVTAAALIDYIVICITYLRFFYATQAQGVKRSSFPYVGKLQPFCGWAGLVGMVLVTLFYGYTAFRSPNIVAPFFFHYTMVIVNPLLYFGWKVFKSTRVVPLQELDLVWERPAIDAYEAALTEPPTTFVSEMAHLFKRTPKKASDESAIPMLPLRD